MNEYIILKRNARSTHPVHYAPMVINVAFLLLATFLIPDPQLLHLKLQSLNVYHAMSHRVLL